MFCRNCGKELSDKSVACTDCGMNPKNGSSHCPECGVETKKEQVICTACGVSLKDGGADGWPTGPYIGLLALSFFIPLFGWIYGGLKINSSALNSERKKQAWHFVFAGVAGIVLNLILMGGG